MSATPEQYDAFAITAPGLAQLAHSELDAIGVQDAEPEEGGVAFAATPELLYSANLHLRTASRVIVRAGEFGATAFHELERRAAKVPWERFIAPRADVSLRVTCRKSRLYHSGAVAERVGTAIAKRVDGVRIVEDTGDDAAGPGQLVLVRMLYDRCTLSVDSSGALLHRRGYRLATAKAPMRETLAAAALIASGWHGGAPLLDPMCGSGTIVIEGALIARRVAPGLRRGFAFEQWPEFDAGRWSELRSAAEGAVLPRSAVVIQGSDRDEGAVAAAVANAERAGVSGDIELSRRAISAIEPPPEAGWLVSNPPYGARVGEAGRLRDLYAQLGNVARTKCAGWRVALVSADAGLERHTGLGLRPVLRTTNGGIRVRVVVGHVGAKELAGQEPG